MARLRRHFTNLNHPAYGNRSNSRFDRSSNLTTDEALQSIVNSQLNKLAESVCQEYQFSSPPINVTEFFIGLVEEEDKFAEDNQMGRYGHSTDRVAKVWLDDQRGVLCTRFPFNQACVDELKTRIPKGKKAWNPSLKIWEFSVECIDDIIDILSHHFQQVVDLTKAIPQSNSSCDTRDSLLALLDDDDKKTIYRILVRKYHPDIAGPSANGKMAEINRLFDANK